MAHFKFIMWLAYWYQEVTRFEFEWDQGNTEKSLKKHQVKSEEIESVFEMRLAVPIGIQVDPVVDEERLCLIGPSDSGRLLSVVFTLRNGKVRPISGRPASKKERGLYEKVGEAVKNL